MRFVMTSWLLLLIWVTFKSYLFFYLFAAQNKLSRRSFMTQCNFIFHALRSLKGRLNGAFFCFFYFIHLKSERLVYPFFFFFVKHKSWTVARCIYIIGIHLERHHRVLMGMRVEVDYRDRTAPLREWNAMFMLGFHQKKKKTHTSDKTYVYPRPYAAQLSASGALSHARRAAEGLIEGVKEGD